MAFVAFYGLWFVSQIAAQFTDDPDVVRDRFRFSQIFAAPIPTLLYHFALQFIGTNASNWGKVSLLGVYVYVPLRWGILLFDPTLLITRPRLTQTGWVPGPGPLNNYFNPFGIPIYPTVAIIFTLIVVTRQYNLQKSHFVRTQIKYIAVSSLIILAAYYANVWARYFGGIVTNQYVSSLAMVVLLLGIRRHGFFAITPQPEMQSEVPLRFNLSQGASYLAFEPEPKHSFEVFSNLALNGHLGLCITRSHPDNIREAYKLKTTPILWLTEEKGDDAVAPSDLHGILLTVRAFLQKAERSVVMLHGLEYLVSVNGFKPVLRLIARLNDLAVQKNGILIIPVLEGSLTERHQTLLSAECPSLQKLEVPEPQRFLKPEHIAQKETLQFKHEDAAKVFRFLTKAFLQDYTIQRIIIDSAGWRTALEIAEGTGLPTRKMYGRDGGPGQAIVELLKRGLAETRLVPGQRGRGGTIMKVRANHGNPYVKAEIDRLALKP